MADEREQELMCLSVPCSHAETPHPLWGLGNHLFVFPGRTEQRQPEQWETRIDESSEISDVRWITDRHGPITRKLVNESHNIFVMLQGQVASLPESSPQIQLVKASRLYRSVLKACCIELHRLADDTMDDIDHNIYTEQLQMFEMVQLIWSLCEILFIDTAPDGMVINQLVDWIRWHFTKGKTQAMEIMRDDDQPDSQPDYWDTVYRLLLQGDTDNARKLLSLHSLSQSDAFTSLDVLLRKMPQSTQYQHVTSTAEFEMRWRHWRDECSRQMEEGLFAAYTNLQTVVQILVGDDAVFTELQPLCETWYHLLVSKLLYQNPTIRAQDLHFHVENCVESFCRDGFRIGELDIILQAAIEFDIHQVIKDSSAFLSIGSWWFVSHLTDILQHCGQLDSHVLAFGSNLREYLLLEYASSLMSHKSLWQVGVDYLDFCPVFGRKYLEHFIEHMPVETEKKAHKLVHICEERNMQEQAQSICKLMGMKSYRHGRLGSALSWFLQSKDVAAATRLTEKFLLEYSEKGEFSHLDLIDNLGPAMLLSNRLTFLGKYREFHKLYEDGDFHAAGSLLLSLLTARLAPKDFWIILILDALPLLETKQVVFSSTQTYELMHCLEELMQDMVKENKSENKALSEPRKQKLELLRLALTRNLSRAIIHEGTIVPS
ncbi:nuclear pore complex protein Nup85-like [Gigantopelta aegis]|uniref:nuclear pore complex protein Nup85-like n=1 Tax=Gigantopelta aegis TaxID=1735272 RepID=UPI001B88A523|nr:nuclear pore complex protein Nup85-like [Gigantopelta aegis]